MGGGEGRGEGVGSWFRSVTHIVSSYVILFKALLKERTMLMIDRFFVCSLARFLFPKVTVTHHVDSLSVQNPFLLIL